MDRKPVKDQSLKVSRLVSMVDRRKWRMPEFQRDLSWNAEQAALMLDSLLYGESLRQIMIWKLVNSDRCHIRTTGRHDTVGKNALLIIDGQQRLTVLTLLMGAHLPEWCSPDNKAVVEIQTKTAYNVVTQEFAKRTLSTKGNEPKEGSQWILARDLLTLTDRDLEALVHRAFGRESCPGDHQSALDRARLVRTRISNSTISVQECAMNLQRAIVAFERWNAGGVALSQEDVLKAVISGHCPGLPSEKIDPFVHDMSGKLGSTDVLKAAIRTLLTYVNHTKNGTPNSRLTELNFSGVTPKEWEQAWDKVEAAWKRVATYLENHHVHSSVITAANPLVPLVLFALVHEDMFADEKMLALYLLGVHTKRFAKHSTDAHMLDAQTILDASSGIEALVEMRDKIMARFESDYGQPYVGVTKHEMLRSRTPQDHMELFYSVMIQRRGAVDWKTGEPLVFKKASSRRDAPSQDLQFHHVYPTALARKHGADIRGKDGHSNPGAHQILNSIAAMALVTGETNRYYSDNAPSNYLKGTQVDRLHQQFWGNAAKVDTLDQAMSAVADRAEKLLGKDAMNWFFALLSGLKAPKRKAPSKPMMPSKRMAPFIAESPKADSENGLSTETNVELLERVKALEALVGHYESLAEQQPSDQKTGTRKSKSTPLATA